MSDQRPPSVAIEIDSFGSGGPEAPAPIGDSGRSKKLVGLTGLLMLLLAGGLLWAVDRSADERAAGIADAAADGEISEPRSEDTETEAIEDLAVVRGDLIDDEAFEWQPIDDRVFDATAFQGGWVALQSEGQGARLVFSADGLDWESFDDSTATGPFRGLDVVDGDIHTLLNVGNELESALQAMRSTDGINFERLPLAEPHITADNQATQVELEFGNRIAVGDQPLGTDQLPETVIELLRGFVNPDIARETCEIQAQVQARGVFDLVSCSGETIGTISDSRPRVADLLSTTSFLLRFQNVVTVQEGFDTLEQIVLDPGLQIATIAPTPDGFLAIALNTLGELDPSLLTLGEPTGVLLRWTSGDGLVDISGQLDPDVELTVDSDLEVSSDGAATIATDDTVYRSETPYRDWPAVRLAPTNTDPGTSALHVGPDGDAVVFTDGLGRIWVGRAGEGWYRAPLLDGFTPIDVLLSNDDAIVVVLGAESDFSPALVRIDLPAPASTEPASPLGSNEIDPSEIIDSVTVGDEVIAITSQGQIAILADGSTWQALPQITSFGLRAIAINAAGPDGVDGVDVLGEVLVMAESTIQNPSRWIGTYRLNPLNGSFAFAVPDFDNARGQLVVGDRQTTSLKDAAVGPLSVALTDGPVTEPEPAINALLAVSLRDGQAQDVCSIVTDRFEDGSKLFDLFDCDGEFIASNRGPGLFPGNEVHDRFVFVQSRLDRRSVVHITGPETSAVQVPLPAGLIGFDVAATEAGAAILASDTRPILEDFNRFYETNSTPHVLLLANPEDGSIREVSLPDEVQNTLVPNISLHVAPGGLGAFQIQSDVGVFLYFAETDAWERISLIDFTDAWERVIGIE